MARIEEPLSHCTHKRRVGLLALSGSVIAHALLFGVLGRQDSPGGSAYSPPALLQVRLQVRPADIPPPVEPTVVPSAKPDGGALVRQNTVMLAHYFSPSELTRKPHFQGYTHEVAPMLVNDAHPPALRAQLFINADGHVEQILLQENELSEAARQLILETLQAMHFSPGMRGQTTVNARLDMEVDLQDAGAPALDAH